MTSSAVVVCTWSGTRREEAEGVLTLARKAASAGALRWLVLGPLAEGTQETASRFGVTRLDHIDDPKLARFAPDAHVEAIAQYCAEQPPKYLLFCQNFDARLTVPRVGGRLGFSVVMGGVDLAIDGEGPLQVTASAYGGDTRVVYEVSGSESCAIAVMANAVEPSPADSATDCALNPIQVDLGAVMERVRVVEAARTEGPRLEDAEIIVSGGRGLGSPENFKLVEQLAEAFGGMAGASRPLVDEGWVDSSRQVGLTGRITRPALYVALGISGASQHMAGCAAAKTIVAVNRDPDASIFRYARYGVVGDCLEIIPELIRAANSN